MAMLITMTTLVKMAMMTMTMLVKTKMMMTMMTMMMAINGKGLIYFSDLRIQEIKECGMVLLLGKFFFIVRSL